VGAVVANWVCYGMPYDTPKQENAAALETKRLTKYCTRRGPFTFGANSHIKSIVKPALMTDRVADPHGFYFKKPFRAVDTNGDTVDGPFHPSPLSSVPMNRLRINHYMVRSIEHYVNDKIRRYAYNSQ
ncbi:unnamed protein product, partial [Phaeothamnion confervicola]